MNVNDGFVLLPDQGSLVWVAGLGVRFMISGDQTQGRFSLVEHPLKPGVLASPMHTHTREDEFSFILEGEVGVQIGERELVGTPGMLVFKPRGVPHAFWNKTGRPARLLEMISPAGFEGYFAEIAQLMSEKPPALAALPKIAEKYGLELDMESIAVLRAKHGLR